MRVEVIPCYSDNYAYLVICEESRLAAAVDPADAGAVVARAEALGLQLAAIWNTHHHFDHTGGNEDLLAAAAERGWRIEVLGWAGSDRIPGLTRGLADGDEIQLGGLAGRVLHTPGHTGDALCYLVEQADLFTGDTLFGGGCGRLFEGDPPTMFASLARLAALPGQTRVWFGHEYTVHNLKFAVSVEPGNGALLRRLAAAEAARAEGRATTPSTIAEELQTNPLLRAGDSAEIRERVGVTGDPIAVFAEVRQRRNRW